MDIQRRQLKQKTLRLVPTAIAKGNVHERVDPGFSDFVNAMVGTATIEQLPTFGIAVLEAPLPWVDLRFGLARLVERYTPKGLRQEES